MQPTPPTRHPLLWRPLCHEPLRTPARGLWTCPLSPLDTRTRMAPLPAQPRIVGAHFFSPAHVMPLLEIVRTRETSPQVRVGSDSARQWSPARRGHTEGARPTGQQLRSALSAPQASSVRVCVDPG